MGGIILLLKHQTNTLCENEKNKKQDKRSFQISKFERLGETNWEKGVLTPLEAREVAVDYGCEKLASFSSFALQISSYFSP